VGQETPTADLVAHARDQANWVANHHDLPGVPNTLHTLADEIERLRAALAAAERRAAEVEKAARDLLALHLGGLSAVSTWDDAIGALIAALDREPEER